MKATELIGKVRELAKREGISALAACKKLNIPHGRYYAAVARRRKKTAKVRRAGATAKPAAKASAAIRGKVPTKTCALFVGTPAQIAEVALALG